VDKKNGPDSILAFRDTRPPMAAPPAADVLLSISDVNVPPFRAKKSRGRRTSRHFGETDVFMSQADVTDN